MLLCVPTWHKIPDFSITLMSMMSDWLYCHISQVRISLFLNECCSQTKPFFDVLQIWLQKSLGKMAATKHTISDFFSSCV